MAAVVALSAGLMGACGDDDDNPIVVDPNTTAVTDASGATRLQLIAADFEFDKETLTATAGQTLKLEIQNNGAVTHNLTVENLNVDMDVQSGATEEQTPVTASPGTYNYFCEFHPDKMKGVLTVS